ncbi:YXWGXW repeat-containing protein [Estrella lausannensis]|uniref:Uncharacterized protein n=1 Tax=Estrella lausannensis TaxID=483423 RepID=A0A0H5DSF4_9BACT|nr:YXWGXW repeat-containing protein [Estrella lausannensis]CRX38699.1 conserved hypothetical protein [Estrella lausannensis]
MSRVLLLFALVMGSLSLEGVPQPIVDANPIHEAFITPVKDPGQIPIVASSPPAPLYEQIPERPYDDVLWIPGYWAWSDAKNDFIWICGVWRRPPPERIWIPGSWVPAQGGFAWQSGLWSLVPEDQLAYIQKTPPPQPNEQIPAAPGENYFWVKGYWEYQPQSDSYSWLSGSWEQIDPHWILSPSIYVWRQSGFVFVPLLWDYTLEERGEAYSCADSQGGQPIAIEAPQIIEQLFFYYPDYINIYWHWGVYHPGWWDGCGCLPPWWGWNDWWTLPWGDSWGLWWWWGHPGSAAPLWMTPELSMLLAPPPAHLLPLFQKAHKPSFPINKGGKDLLPKGPKSLLREPKGQKPIPRPKIPDIIKPGGYIKPPSRPGRFVLPQDSLRPKGKGQREGTLPGQQVNPDRVNPRWETAPANVRPKVWIPPKGRRPGRDDDGDRPDRASGGGKTPPGYTPSDGSESPQWRRPSRPTKPQEGKTPQWKRPSRQTVPQSENPSNEQGDAVIKNAPSQSGKPTRFTTPPPPQDNAPREVGPPPQQRTVIKQAPPQVDRPVRVNFPSRQQSKGSNAPPPSQGIPDVQQAAPRPKRELPELAPRIRERIRERADSNARSKKDD